MKRYVLGFMFDLDREKVLLVEKVSPPWQAGKLNGVGGKAEEGEVPIAAMVREFAEETGYNTEFSDWEYKLTLLGPDWEVAIFRAEGNIQLAKQMTEKDKPHCVFVNRLPQSVIPNLHWIVPFLLDKSSIQARVKYFSFNEA